MTSGDNMSMEDLELHCRASKNKENSRSSKGMRFAPVTITGGSSKALVFSTTKVNHNLNVYPPEDFITCFFKGIGSVASVIWQRFQWSSNLKLLLENP